MSLDLEGLDVGTVLKLLGELIEDPTSNLTAAVLLLGLVATVALVLVVVIVLVALAFEGGDDEDEEDEDGEGDDEEEDEEEEEPLTPEEIAREQERERRRAARAARFDRMSALFFKVMIVALTLTVLGSMVYAYRYTGTRRFCAVTCHATSTEVKAAARDPHRSVRCIECHESGPVEGVVERGEHLAARVLSKDLAVDEVGSARCLACHEGDIARPTVNKRLQVRMSHAEPIRAGMSCADCHAKAGHGTAWGGGMAKCLSCHDAKTASAECDTCHIGDPTKASRTEHTFPRVEAANKDCSACHDMRSCNACHGISMPHTAEFMRDGHAKEAVFDRKLKCRKCHGDDYQECYKCHSDFKMAHVAGRIQTLEDHRRLFPREMLAQPVTACGCHQSRPYANFCALCHDDAGGPLYAPEQQSGAPAVPAP